MRVYRIKDKSSDNYLIGTQWTASGYVPRFRDASIKGYLDIKEVNLIIDDIFNANLQELLNNCTLENYNISEPQKIAEFVKLSTMCKRREQQLVIDKLKGDTSDNGIWNGLWRIF